MIRISKNTIEPRVLNILIIELMSHVKFIQIKNFRFYNDKIINFVEVIEVLIKYYFYTIKIKLYVIIVDLTRDT